MRNRWYRQESLLSALQFTIANGIPILDAISDFPIPNRVKQRMIKALSSGASLGEALQNAGVPQKDAMLLDLKGGASVATAMLDMNLKSSRMSSAFKATLAESFGYPNVIVILSIFCWLFLRSMGFSFIHHWLWNLIFLFALFLILSMQLLFFLPWEKVPLLSKMKLLEDAQVLFVYLGCSIARGVDQSTSVRMAMEDLGLSRATGKDAGVRMDSGLPFLKVLGEMPAVKAVRFGVPDTDRAELLLETLARAADEEWKTKAENLQLFLKTAGLFLAGAVLFVLTIQLFLSIYTSGVE